jgi:hypothetical protein
MEGQLSTIHGRQMIRCRDELQQSPWVIHQGKQGAGGISKWYLGVCTYILRSSNAVAPAPSFFHPCYVQKSKLLTYLNQQSYIRTDLSLAAQCTRISKTWRAE